MEIKHSAITDAATNETTFKWEVILEEGEKLHTISCGIIADPITDSEGNFVESNSRNFYKWAHDNPNNGEPELIGERKFDVRAWYPDWKTLGVYSYACKFNDAENPIADQYSCEDALPKALTITNPNASSSGASNKPARKKK